MEDRDSENRKCFLCEIGEAGEKLTSVAYKGKKSLEKFCTDSGLTELSEKLVTEWNNSRIYAEHHLVIQIAKFVIRSLSHQRKCGQKLRYLSFWITKSSKN